ncbi:MAG: 1-deoxy-D-xylulose-5-phosphate reductoisomerase [Alphaproteobacteria bacterium]|nr:1-deoxy-D-xylulose-5-phosphate reductoisomerase [Alphaproteobacteria bacterium]
MSNSTNAMKRIGIWGSTGSIGKQTLEIIESHPDLFCVEVLIANDNVELLTEQVIRYKPHYVAINNLKLLPLLQSNLRGKTCVILGGRQDIIDLAAAPDYDFMVAAMVGISGLEPVIRAIEHGKTIGLANKETLVVAGEIITSLALKHQATLIPIDSEHNAIFQCLQGENPSNLSKIYLTASGGPFLGKKTGYLESVKALHALRNPNWTMGKKVTIDSATLMNKGLELIEAKWLFNVTPQQLEVVIHKQSIVHSMVEFEDGSIKAQLSLPDMRFPIQYALSNPNRIPNFFPRLNWKNMKSLDFEEPDTKTFRNLELAQWALKHGGNLPCILNAANEIVVNAYLEDRIGFIDMMDIIEKTLLNIQFDPHPNLEKYFETDKISRTFAESQIKNVRVKY